MYILCECYEISEHLSTMDAPIDPQEVKQIISKRQGVLHIASILPLPSYFISIGSLMYITSDNNKDDDCHIILSSIVRCEVHRFINTCVCHME